ncbi:hypothetical protein [Sphingomonas sp. BAUL-RG-20F-R05-02]|uniref:hypothetical protein n=1 Tax=Sphingomonas sp. BAUL-RG-20F-R05-02 TaxID=2914830 RepID=UPI001F591268|nr:hypothetical protein [Sphingomonas sp. BAUL-RG-20F-R05-02]
MGTYIVRIDRMRPIQRVGESRAVPILVEGRRATAIFNDRDFANLIMRAADTRAVEPGYRDAQALEEAVSRAIEAGRLTQGFVRVQREDID